MRRFTIGVMDGDRVVRWPSETAPIATNTEDDQDVWSGNGPPPETPPADIEVGDTYIDLTTGNVYRLDPN